MGSVLGCVVYEAVLRFSAGGRHVPQFVGVDNGSFSYAVVVHCVYSQVWQ